MPSFDPIASPTVHIAPHREPALVFPDETETARQKLAQFSARAGRRPNILVILFDDVGWGDFGCYGGGVAVGAPTPVIDALARRGLRLTSCYSEPSCSPSRGTLLTGRLPRRHGLQRPPMYGEPGGLQGEVTLPQLLAEAGYVTQAVGKWHLGEVDRVSDRLMSFSDLLPIALTLAGVPDRVPADRYVDGIDQTSFLLAPNGASCRKYHYYWLVDTFSALRVGEYKWMLSSISDDATDVHGAGGFTGITQRYTYPRLFNLYLDPKENRSYLTRKLAYAEVLREGLRAHLATFQAYPPKRVMGLRAPAPGRPPA